MKPAIIHQNPEYYDGIDNTPTNQPYYNVSWHYQHETKEWTNNYITIHADRGKVVGKKYEKNKKAMKIAELREREKLLPKTTLYLNQIDKITDIFNFIFCKQRNYNNKLT